MSLDSACSPTFYPTDSLAVLTASESTLSVLSLSRARPLYSLLHADDADPALGGKVAHGSKPRLQAKVEAPPLVHASS